MKRGNSSSGTEVSGNSGFPVEFDANNSQGAGSRMLTLLVLLALYFKKYIAWLLAGAK